jgi:hypothetical protein
VLVFPEPFGPRKPKHLALADREGNTGERGRPARVDLPQLLDLDRRRPGAVSGCAHVAGSASTRARWLRRGICSPGATTQESTSSRSSCGSRRSSSSTASVRSRDAARASSGGGFALKPAPGRGLRH